MEEKPGSSRLGRAQFTIEKELDFAQYLVDLKRANRINKGNLKSEVFLAIVQKFAEKGSIFDSNQVRAKYYALRSQTYKYNRMRLRVTGAGWDPMKMTVTMDTEKWTSLIQENPSFETFRDRDCRVFYMLSEVFDKMDAQGKYSRHSSQPSVDINEEIRARQSQTTGPIDDSEDELKPKAKQKKGKGKRKTPKASTQEPALPLGLSRVSYDNAIAWMDATFSATHSTSASVDGPGPPSPPPPHPPPPSPPVSIINGPFGVAKANEALNAIEDLPDKVFVTAAVVLTDSEAHRITFLSQKSEARRRLYVLKIGGGQLDD